MASSPTTPESASAPGSSPAGRPASAPPQRRGRAGLIVILVIIVAALAVLGVLGYRNGTFGGGSDEAEVPVIPSTTFPNPPGSVLSAQDIVDGGEKSTFTSDLAPEAVVDDYLENFAVIGWTTLSNESDDTRAVLKLQGGNRYATIVVVRGATASSGVVCQGVDADAVTACAFGE